jgi:hypothetical protein
MHLARFAVVEYLVSRECADSPVVRERGNYAMERVPGRGGGGTLRTDTWERGGERQMAVEVEDAVWCCAQRTSSDGGRLDFLRCRPGLRLSTAEVRLSFHGFRVPETRLCSLSTNTLLGGGSGREARCVEAAKTCNVCMKAEEVEEETSKIWSYMLKAGSTPTQGTRH